jgi:hypothetical protein
MKKQLFGLALLSLAMAAFVHPRADAQAPADRPVFTADGKLQRPDNYREWIYLTSGLGMTYGPTQPTSGQPRFFDNVFVTRDAYRGFMQTGKWPEGTMLVLEIRRSAQNASIDNGGQTQAARVTIEVEVKDSARFPDTGWGFFDFSGTPDLATTAARLPLTASCYACHKNNTAVENTFVQFYPTLMEVAQRLGTVKPTYDPNHKVSQ